MKQNNILSYLDIMRIVNLLHHLLHLDFIDTGDKFFHCPEIISLVSKKDGAHNRPFSFHDLEKRIDEKLFHFCEFKKYLSVLPSGSPISLTAFTNTYILKVTLC